MQSRKTLQSILLLAAVFAVTAHAYTGFTSSVSAVSGMLTNYTLTSNPLTSVANLNTASPKFLTSQSLAGGSIVGVNGTGFGSNINILLLTDAIAHVQGVGQTLLVINFYSLVDGSFQTQLTVYSGPSILLTVPKVYAKGNTVLIAHKADSTSTNLYMSEAVYNPTTPASSTITRTFVTSGYTGPVVFFMDELNNIAVAYKTSVGTYVKAYGTTSTIASPLASSKYLLTAYSGGWTLYAYTTSAIHSASDTSLTMAATSSSPPPTGYTVLGVSGENEQLYYAVTVSGTTTVYDSTGATILTTTDTVSYFDGENGILINSVDFTVLTAI